MGPPPKCGPRRRYRWTASRSSSSRLGLRGLAITVYHDISLIARCQTEAVGPAPGRSAGPASRRRGGDNRAMAVVRSTAQYPGAVHEAERCWYDTKRWPVWVDQLARVVEVDGDWPGVGSTVRWESGPAGRGRVREHVVAYEPLGGQTLE